MKGSLLCLQDVRIPKVICSAKKLHYNNIILKSKNKMKSTWKIINNEKGITQQDMSIPQLVLNNKRITNQHKIANIFNSYFISVADSIKEDRSDKVTASSVNPINYLLKYFNKPFSKMNWQYTSTYK